MADQAFLAPVPAHLQTVRVRSVRHYTDSLFAFTCERPSALRFRSGEFVMIGGMLSGTRPTPGKVFEENGKKFKQYRGMASFEAQHDFMGGVPEWKTAEGVAVNVPYREDEEAIIADIIGGLRSGLTYGGAATIAELRRKVSYVVVTQAGRTESLAHKAL